MLGSLTIKPSRHMYRQGDIFSFFFYLLGSLTIKTRSRIYRLTSWVLLLNGVSRRTNHRPIGGDLTTQSVPQTGRNGGRGREERRGNGPRGEWWCRKGWSFDVGGDSGVAGGVLRGDSGAKSWDGGGNCRVVGKGAPGPWLSGCDWAGLGPLLGL